MTGSLTPHTAALDDTRRAMRLFGLAALLMVAISTLGPMVVHVMETSPAAKPGLAWLVLSQLWCGVELTRRHSHPIAPWGMLVATEAALLWMLHFPGPNDPNDWAPGYWAVPLVTLAISVMERRAYFVYAGVMAVGLVIPQAVAIGKLDPFAITDLFWVVMPLFETLLLGDALVRVATARDRRVREQVAAHATKLRTEAEHQARSESARLLHDHVLHALHGLARSNTPDARVHAVLDCRTAVQSLAETQDEHEATTEAPRGDGDSPEAGSVGQQTKSRLWFSTPDDSSRRALVSTVWPVVVTNLATTLLAGRALPHADLLVPLALLSLAVTVFGALYLQFRPVNLLLGIMLLTPAIVGWQANLAVLPADATDPYLLWLGWIAIGAIHLVMVCVRLWLAVAVMLSWFALQLIGLLLTVADPAQLVPLSSTVSMGIGDFAITVLVLATVRRQATGEITAARVAREMQEETERLQDAYRMDHFWSRRVTGEVMPLLQGVADGSIDPGIPVVQRSAQAMEVAVRDELVLGPENALLVAAMNSTRRAGWTLSSSLGREDSATALRQARLLLDLLGEPLDSTQRVTISATQRGATAVVLGATSTEQRARWKDCLERLDGAVQTDDDFVRLALGR